MRARSGFAALVFIGVLAMAMFSTQAGAYPGFDTSPGQPGGPQLCSPADGMQLHGVLVAEFSNIIGTTADARIAVRLRGPNQQIPGNTKLVSLYAEAFSVEYSSMATIQDSVQSAIGWQILQSFGLTGTVCLSGINEMSSSDWPDNVSPLAFQSEFDSWKSLLSSYVAPGQVKQIVPPLLPVQQVSYFFADITVTVK